MALVPSISVAQSATSPNNVLISDTSTGSDVAITQRRVYVQTSTGLYLVPTGTSTSYTQWNIANATILLNILNTDYAVSITTQWLDIGNNVLYTYTNEYPLVQYNKQFFYYLIQQQSLNYSKTQDANYMANMAVYWMNIIGAINAVYDGADIAASQNCINRATNMMQQQNYYFN